MAKTPKTIASTWGKWEWVPALRAWAIYREAGALHSGMRRQFAFVEDMTDRTWRVTILRHETITGSWTYPKPAEAYNSAVSFASTAEEVESAAKGRILAEEFFSSHSLFPSY